MFPTLSPLLALALLALSLVFFSIARAGGLRALWGSFATPKAAQDAFTSVVKIDTFTISGATTTYSRAFDVAGLRKCTFFANFTAIAGGASVTITVQISIDGGITWMDQDSFAVTTTAILVRKDPTAEIGLKCRFKQVTTVGGTATVDVYLAYISPSLLQDRS